MNKCHIERPNINKKPAGYDKEYIMAPFIIFFKM